MSDNAYNKEVYRWIITLNDALQHNNKYKFGLFPCLAADY